ncbi:uncharacterized protein LOC107659272 [Sinocyclocheilus anshuiensis]|uniref:uncharacterized protein LOC107659272 n=1 Tax=Sinocyclocheilus anshuiensis TaxID=1608454 RepID=UPI0007BABE12|nr:PREDICTED: uncharacterized protein LOC107659272 [Sinocyclocheilus anshuiensis]
MRRTSCVLMSVLLMIADGLIVKGPSGPLVAPLGSSVVLPCSVDELLSVEDLEVEWRRTDSETLVHLYQDGESRAEAQHQDYQDRAHFFTDQIQHGNFSLRLDDLRAEDEGQYKCKVHSQQESGETVVQIKVNAERLLVSGSSRSISASVGEDVTLNCSVDSHIPPEDFEEVSWKKTDEDIQVLLYQNNEAHSSNERYIDRVELFTAEIPKGNFSLRLKSIRTEDKGVYMCEVFAGGLSANATVVLEQLGEAKEDAYRNGYRVLYNQARNTLNKEIRVSKRTYAKKLEDQFTSNDSASVWKVSASGSALLLCCLIYCRSPTKDTVFRLQMFLVFCPNVLMSLAFVLWGVSEGSLFESVSCCALYFLRPLMLLWTAPYVNEFTGKIKTWVQNYSSDTEYMVFSAVFYSVLFKSAWDKSLNYGGFEGVMIIVLFVMVILFNLFFIIRVLLVRLIGKLSQRIITIFVVLANISFNVLPSLQFILLFFAFGSGRGDLPRVVAVYVFGSVGVVLLNSVALITELILKTVNGEGAMGDMRIVVFSSEFLFTFILMVLMVFEPWITPCLQSCQKAIKSRRAAAAGSQHQESQNAAADSASGSNQNQNQNPAESHEMKALLEKQNQETGRSDGAEETQPESVVSQT